MCVLHYHEFTLGKANLNCSFTRFVSIDLLWFEYEIKLIEIEIQENFIIWTGSFLISCMRM